MKKLKMIFFILITIPMYSQWVQQNSGTLEDLNDVYCITDNVVVIVGRNGTILKTTDGGVNWIAKTSNTTNDLVKVQFANQNVGFAVGNNGTFLKTIDGGNNWNVINIGETSYLNSLACVNENTIYICSNDIFKKSTDGGLTFNSIASYPYNFATKIQFITEFVGFVLTGNTLLKTIDGGFSWNQINISNVLSYNFFNENVGYINTGNGFFKTTNGGLTNNYLDTISHSMYELFAVSEEVIWGVTGMFLLNGQPNFTTRCQKTNLGSYQRTDSSWPLFKAIYFSNPQNGYGVLGEMIYKNITGNLLNNNNLSSKDLCSIVPNPVNDFVVISLKNDSKSDIKVQINDFLGKNVFEELFNFEKEIKINTKIFAKGTYFLTVENDNKKQVQKLIIN